MTWNWPESFVGKWWTKKGECTILNADGTCENQSRTENWKGVWEYREESEGIELYLRTDTKIKIKYMPTSWFNVKYQRTLYRKALPKKRHPDVHFGGAVFEDDFPPAMTASAALRKEPFHKRSARSKKRSQSEKRVRKGNRRRTQSRPETKRIDLQEVFDEVDSGPGLTLYENGYIVDDSNDYDVEDSSDVITVVRRRTVGDEDWLRNPYEDESPSDLIPPPFPSKLFNRQKDRGDPPSSPKFSSEPADIPERSRSFHEPRRKSSFKRKTPSSVFHTIPNPSPMPSPMPKITHEQEFIFDPQNPTPERSPQSSSMSNLLNSQKKPKSLPRSSTYTGNRRRPDKTEHPFFGTKGRKRRARNRTVGVAQINTLNDHIFGESKRQAGAHPSFSRFDNKSDFSRKRKPSDSRRVDSFDKRVRDDSPDTVTTVTSSDMIISLTSLDKTIIGQLTRRYSFANVYQCKRGSVVFKLAFHNSPFTGEDILSNVRKLFQFATLSIDYQGFECSLLEPIRILDIKKSYSDFDNLKLELTNFHDGTLSGRFTGDITNMRNGSVTRKVRIPLDIQFHCTTPSRSAERLAESVDHQNLDLVE